MRLSKDLLKAAKTLSHQEARYLVDSYYVIQKNRIAEAHQKRKLDESGKPHAVLDYLTDQSLVLESQIKRALDAWTKEHSVGRWMRSIDGIGPVIAAGMLAHLGTLELKTASSFWRFAGLDPTVKWEKGQIRPWNAALKVLCWKLGESFVLVSGKPSAYYGKIYAERKLLENTRNDAGAFAEQAAASLRDRKWDKSTDAYKAYITGKLPAARIHLRAERYAVKMFLSHLFHMLYVDKHGATPPMPYIIEHGGHTHYAPPPTIQ